MARSRGSRAAAGARAGGDEHRRVDRVAAEVQRVLADLLVRRSKDPRLLDVTITAVRLSPDLRFARVFVTMLGGPEQRAATLAALEHAVPFLRRGIAQAISLRYVPDLVFAYDEVLEGARRIDSLLRGLHDEPGEGGSDPEGSGGAA